MEQYLVDLLKEYGYIVLFFWSIFEGEIGLIMAGILSFTGDMYLPYAILTASLGGFAGDQLYFLIGRKNKEFILKELRNHRRKFALASLLMKKYGSIIVFIQRYLYGLRTIIPMAIGVTNYSYLKYSIINFISAIIWASLTIIISYFYGEELLYIIKNYKYYLLIGFIFVLLVIYLKKRKPNL